MREVASRVGAWISHRWKAILVVAGATTFITAIVTALWLLDPVTYPAHQAAELTRRLDTVATPFELEREKLRKDIAQFQTDNQIKIWTTIVQATGAVVLAIGGYFAYRNLQVAQRNLQATQDKLDVDRESQVTNRYTQAIGQLGAELKDGSPSLEIRLGGIYALERIAKDSPRDHWPIMEVLTTYVRQHAPGLHHAPEPAPPATQAPWPPAQAELTGQLSAPETDGAVLLAAPRGDIQAALDVLGRRNRTQETAEQRLELHCADLRGAYLGNAHLEGANLWQTRLEGANLRKAFWRGPTCAVPA